MKELPPTLPRVSLNGVLYLSFTFRFSLFLFSLKVRFVVVVVFRHVSHLY